MNYTVIVMEFEQSHWGATLVADVMFVNQSPFVDYTLTWNKLSNYKLVTQSYHCKPKVVS